MQDQQDHTVIPGVQTIMLARIRRDKELQLRYAMNFERIDEFKVAMQDGAQFPPVVVFYDGIELWLADGFHRITAATRAGWLTLETDVREGSQADAMAHAFFANALHGEPLRPKERRDALPRIVALFPGESTRALGARLGVSHGTIALVRRALEPVKNLTASPDVAPADTDNTNPELAEWVQDAMRSAEAGHQLHQDTVQTVLDVAGDDDGAWERARRLAYYSARIKAGRELILLKPDAVADLLDDGHKLSATAFCDDMPRWCAQLATALRRGIRLVGEG